MNHNPDHNSKLLIIHIGADKCASSSLQASLGALNKSYPELQNYQFLKNNLLLKNNESGPQPKKLEYLKSIFEKTTSSTLILSNEGLMGESLPSLHFLCKTALEDYNFKKILITMYSRSPASHAISSYHQWFFRYKEILKSDIKAVQDAGLDSDLLTPLERRLIVILSKKQFRNWNTIIQNVRDQTHQFGRAVKLVSRHIPTKDNNYSLLSDFLGSANILEKYRNISLAKLNKRANNRFSEQVTHAFATLLCKEEYSEMFLPGPHELNQFFLALSLPYKDVKFTSSESLDKSYIHLQQNLDQLTFSVDELARDGTTKYCKEFSLELESFFHRNPGNNLPAIELIKENLILRDKKLIEAFNRNCINKVSESYKKLSSNISWLRVARKVF